MSCWSRGDKIQTFRRWNSLPATNSVLSCQKHSSFTGTAEGRRPRLKRVWKPEAAIQSSVYTSFRSHHSLSSGSGGLQMLSQKPESPKLFDWIKVKWKTRCGCCCCNILLTAEQQFRVHDGLVNVVMCFQEVHQESAHCFHCFVQNLRFKSSGLNRLVCVSRLFY